MSIGTPPGAGMIPRPALGVSPPCQRVLDPGLEQRIGHRQHHRPDKYPDQPEAEQAADDAGKNQQQRQIGAFLDEDRAQEIVQRRDNDAPDEQEGRPAVIASPVHPGHRREKHQRWPDLGDAQHQHHRRQQRGEGNTGDGKADPAEQSLHDRRHADAERNAANGLAGENDGIFAALAGQP